MGYNKPIVKIMDNSYYSTDEDIKKLLAYISGHGSNKGKEYCHCDSKGLSRDYKIASKQIIESQTFMKKNCKRRVYHFVISFPKRVSLSDAVTRAYNISDFIFQTNACYWSVHTSTDNLHIHIAMNAVCWNTGKKWNMSHKKYKEFKNTLENLAAGKSMISYMK